VRALGEVQEAVYLVTLTTADGNAEHLVLSSNAATAGTRATREAGLLHLAGRLGDVAPCLRRSLVAACFSHQRLADKVFDRVLDAPPLDVIGGEAANVFLVVHSK
jgi:hypothetical protein